MKTKLTKEEQKILGSFEKGEWVPVKNLSKRKAELMKYARNTLKKDKKKNPLPALKGGVSDLWHNLAIAHQYTS